MIHATDEDTFRQLLGFNCGVTPAIEREYDLRQGMLHRAGLTGPLGARVLVDVLRFLGVEPDLEGDNRPGFDIRRLKPGDRVLVNEKGEGTYRGMLPNGAHKVVIDGDEWVHEVPGYSLGPVPEPAEEPTDWSAVDEKAPVVAILEDDGKPVEASFIRLEEDKLVVCPDGGKKYHRIDPEHCALADGQDN